MSTHLTAITPVEIIQITKYTLFARYQADQDRMEPIRDKCSHFKYKTREKFISKLQSLIKQQKKCRLGPNWSYIDAKIYEESGRGVCQYCSLYFASDFL